jgi:hypothetical protein
MSASRIKVAGFRTDNVRVAIQESTAVWEGWSLARQSHELGVGDMTVRRYMLLSGVVMRSPNERPDG